MWETKCSKTFKLGEFFFRITVLTGVFTVPFFTAMFMPLIYVRLTICVEDLIMLSPLTARLSTEVALLFLFGFFVTTVFAFFIRLLLLLIAVVFTIISLPVIRLGFSSPVAALHSLVHFCFSSASVHFNFSSPLFACHSLTSASHSQCRLIVILRFLQESYKSSYRPARYVTNFLL